MLAQISIHSKQSFSILCRSQSQTLLASSDLRLQLTPGLFLELQGSCLLQGPGHAEGSWFGSRKVSETDGIFVTMLPSLQHLSSQHSAKTCTAKSFIYTVITDSFRLYLYFMLGIEWEKWKKTRILTGTRTCVYFSWTEYNFCSSMFLKAW